MGGSCRTYGRDGGAYSVSWGDLSEGGHLEDLGVKGIIRLKWIFKENEIVGA